MRKGVRILLAALLIVPITSLPARADEPGAAGGPSAAGAFFRSLLVPGWGQYAQGTPGRAAVFGVIEGVLLLGASGHYAMHTIYRDDYRALAESVAGANIRDKDIQYFNDMAFYESRLRHNQLAYTQDHGEPELYGVADDWQWPSDAERLRYRSRLNDSKTMKQRFNYAIAIISLNHLASAIDAAKRASGRAVEQTPDVGFVPSHDGGARAVLTWHLE